MRFSGGTAGWNFANALASRRHTFDPPDIGENYLPNSELHRVSVAGKKQPRFELGQPDLLIPVEIPIALADLYILLTVVVCNGILAYVFAPLRPRRTRRISGLIVQRQVSGDEIRRFNNALGFALLVEVEGPPPAILRRLWRELGRTVGAKLHCIVARG